MPKALTLATILCLLLCSACIHNNDPLNNLMVYGPDEIRINPEFEYLGDARGSLLGRDRIDLMRTTNLAISAEIFTKENAYNRVTEFVGVNKVYFRDKRWIFTPQSLADSFHQLRLDPEKDRDLIKDAQEKGIEFQDCYVIYEFNHMHTQQAQYQLSYGFACTRIPSDLSTAEAEELVKKRAHEAYHFVKDEKVP